MQLQRYGNDRVIVSVSDREASLYDREAYMCILKYFEYQLIAEHIARNKVYIESYPFRENLEKTILEVVKNRDMIGHKIPEDLTIRGIQPGFESEEDLMFRMRIKVEVENLNKRLFITDKIFGVSLRLNTSPHVNRYNITAFIKSSKEYYTLGIYSSEKEAKTALKKIKEELALHNINWYRSF